MNINPLNRILRVAAFFVMGVFVTGCFLLGDPDVDPDKEEGSLRAYSEETATSTVKMSENTIFVKGNISRDLQSFDSESGTITFANSDGLKLQEIKVGDILYSTDRTDKTPDGYCLRVVGIDDSGDSVTYQTEPATALEAIDYLNEYGVLSAGNYKPEDIRVFGLPEGDVVPETRGISVDNEGIEIKGDKLDFFSDTKVTRFGYILFEDKDYSDDLKSSFKIKLTLEFQHDLDTEKSNVMLEFGNFVLFTMFKVGVSAKLEIGTTLALEGNQDSLLSKEQERIARERLVGKKFKIAEIPLNFTCSKIIVDPKLIVYGEFKLDVSGKLVFEAGIKDGTYSFNLANNGSFSTDFKTNSYLRRVAHFQPFMHMEGRLGFSAMAGFGVGVNFEIPSMPVITEDDGSIAGKRKEPSGIGIYYGAELTEDITVTAEADFFSGNREFKIEGKNGALKLKASVEGKVGLRKKVWGNLDWTFWENEMITLPDWEWSIYSWTPTPYDLESVVNDDNATVALSWKVPDRNGVFNKCAVNIGTVVSGKVSLSPFVGDLVDRSTTFGPSADGTYYWNVTTHALDGGTFPSDTCSFVIDASTVTTGVPEKNGDAVTVPVEVNTLNNVLERGVVYSAERDEPLADVDKECHYSGSDNFFSLDINGLQQSVTYYMRGYALISVDGGSRYVYGNTVEYKEQIVPATITVTPAEIDFGKVEYGTSRSEKFTMKNTGKGIAKFSVACESHENVFEVNDGGAEFTLDAGASKPLIVTAHGMKRGYSASCDIRVISDAENGTQTLHVQAEGWDNQPLALETTSKTMKVGDIERVDILFGSLNYELVNESPTVVRAIISTEGGGGGGRYDHWTSTVKYVNLEALSVGTATLKVTDKERNEQVTLVVTVTGGSASIPVPEAVDLGLPSGLKWASFNLGASKPEEYGDYYAWGETEPYYSSQDPLTWKEGKEAGYDWPSYKWCMGSNDTMIKYCTNSSYGYNGFMDGKAVLDPEDDAAHVKLGGKWRMPTLEDQEELQEKCSWEWAPMNSVNGYKVTGPNGNSIFFPAAGSLDYLNFYGVGSTGFCWSSSLFTGDPSRPYYQYFHSGNVGLGYIYRFYGFSVRPVTE